MEKWWFNSIKEELERRCVLSKSIGSLGPIENTRRSKNWSLNCTEIHSWSDSDSSGYSNVDHLFDVSDIRNLISDDTFLVRDSEGDFYSIYFDIENQIFQIDNDSSFLSELQSLFFNYWNSSYLNTGSKNDDSYYDYINSCIDRYLHSQSSILSGSGNYSDSYIISYICDVSKSSCIRTGANGNGSDLTQENNGNGSDLTQENNGNGSDLTQENNGNGSDLTQKNDFDNPERTQKFRHLWILCENENCYTVNYRQLAKLRLYTCEQCGYHMKMSSSDRIESSIDPGTWNPMDEDMVSIDPAELFEFHSESEEEEEEARFYPEFLPEEEELYSEEEEFHPEEEEFHPEEEEFHPEEEEFHPEEEEFHPEEEEFHPEEEEFHPEEAEEARFYPEFLPEEAEFHPEEAEEAEFHSEEAKEAEEAEEEESYKDKIHSYQGETGLTEAVQTGIGQLNGIPVAIGVMDFRFIGGSMGSVVGEKITRLIEYATKKFLPLIIVCASGGARMQEGSLSLMQMAKIASALYDYQSNKKLFYVSILTSPTTGGVTASFGMLGDIIIAEPNAYIAFAGKRVIEELLKVEVPEGSQETEYLFDKGMFDPIVPRNLLKDVLSELFQLHTFFPLNQAEH
uniref:acetyl-CoA carboxylase carboxyltransferase beta subunit n=1 Tax=Habropetalum dawei TaxID=122300 RepID=UPI002A807BEF|nr:acetyl-CoA carboxylase carboxyltransferase beta subunit [Habropetalum dawei]UZP15855.1 acetyl-CoA carboxylase carboxyltransferase beta subunit [Habropetalum dawei]